MPSQNAVNHAATKYEALELWDVDLFKLFEKNPPSPVHHYLSYQPLSRWSGIRGLITTGHLDSGRNYFYFSKHDGSSYKYTLTRNIDEEEILGIYTAKGSGEYGQRPKMQLVRRTPTIDVEMVPVVLRTMTQQYVKLTVTLLMPPFSDIDITYSMKWSIKATVAAVLDRIRILGKVPLHWYLNVKMCNHDMNIIPAHTVLETVVGREICKAYYFKQYKYCQSGFVNLCPLMCVCKKIPEYIKVISPADFPKVQTVSPDDVPKKKRAKRKFVKKGNTKVSAMRYSAYIIDLVSSSSDSDHE